MSDSPNRNLRTSTTPRKALIAWSQSFISDLFSYLANSLKISHLFIPITQIYIGLTDIKNQFLIS